jgi:hypothetical protein
MRRAPCSDLILKQGAFNRKINLFINLAPFPFFVLWGLLFPVMFHRNICFFSIMTGHHCWGCGITRACHAFLEGNFNLAWMENPLIFIVFPALLYDFTLGFCKLLMQE